VRTAGSAAVAFACGSLPVARCPRALPTRTATLRAIHRALRAHHTGVAAFTCTAPPAATYATHRYRACRAALPAARCCACRVHARSHRAVRPAYHTTALLAARATHRCYLPVSRRYRCPRLRHTTTPYRPTYTPRFVLRGYCMRLPLLRCLPPDSCGSAFTDVLPRIPVYHCHSLARCADSLVYGRVGRLVTCLPTITYYHAMPLPCCPSCARLRSGFRTRITHYTPPPVPAALHGCHLPAWTATVTPYTGLPALPLRYLSFTVQFSYGSAGSALPPGGRVLWFDTRTAVTAAPTYLRLVLQHLLRPPRATAYRHVRFFNALRCRCTLRLVPAHFTTGYACAITTCPNAPRTLAHTASPAPAYAPHRACRLTTPTPGSTRPHLPWFAVTAPPRTITTRRTFTRCLYYAFGFTPPATYGSLYGSACWVLFFHLLRSWLVTCYRLVATLVLVTFPDYAYCRSDPTRCCLLPDGWTVLPSSTTFAPFYLRSAITPRWRRSELPFRLAVGYLHSHCWTLPTLPDSGLRIPGRCICPQLFCGITGRTTGCMHTLHFGLPAWITFGYTRLVGVGYALHCHYYRYAAATPHLLRYSCLHAALRYTLARTFLPPHDVADWTYTHIPRTAPSTARITTRAVAHTYPCLSRHLHPGLPQLPLPTTQFAPRRTCLPLQFTAYRTVAYRRTYPHLPRFDSGYRAVPFTTPFGMPFYMPRYMHRSTYCLRTFLPVFYAPRATIHRFSSPPRLYRALLLPRCTGSRTYAYLPCYACSGWTWLHCYTHDTIAHTHIFTTQVGLVTHRSLVHAAYLPPPLTHAHLPAAATPRTTACPTAVLLHTWFYAFLLPACLRIPACLPLPPTRRCPLPRYAAFAPPLFAAPAMRSWIATGSRFVVHTHYRGFYRACPFLRCRRWFGCTLVYGSYRYLYITGSAPRYTCHAHTTCSRSGSGLPTPVHPLL